MFFKVKLIISLLYLCMFYTGIFAQNVAFVQDIQFSPDGNYVVAIGNIGYPYFRVWDIENATILIDMFPYVDSNIFDVDWSPDSTRVAITSDDGYLRVWNVADSGYATGTLLAEMKTDGIFAPVEWSPDDLTIAVGVNFGGSVIQFWDTTTYLLQEKITSLQIELMDWNSSNNNIAAIYDPGFDPPYAPYILPSFNSTDEFVILCPDECAEDFSRSVKWSNDGTKVAIGSTGGIKIVDVGSNQVILDIITGSSVFTLDWSYDDRFLVGLNSGVKIWSAETGEILDTFGSASAVDFSPNDYEIAYVDANLVDLVIQDVSYLVPTDCNHSIPVGKPNNAIATPDITTCTDETH